MRVVRSNSEFHVIASEAKQSTAQMDCFVANAPRNDILGFVPTMGALHQGHVSLVERARQECSRVCVSIFVNPLQFGPNEDYDKYPRTEEADLKLLREAGADIVWLPSVEDLYGNDVIAAANNVIASAAKQSTHSVILNEVKDPHAATKRSFALRAQDDDIIYANPDLANRLCGLNRPGHFDGVCSVVKNLLDAVKPDRAYFGEKDYQQLMIIREMVTRLNIPVEIIGCPILREADGLAMSSRNRYLSEDERKLAAMLYQELLQVKSEILHSPTAAQKRDVSHVSAIARSVSDEAIQNLETLGFKIDYLEQHWNRLFIAARLGSTRLIDNIALNC